MKTSHLTILAALLAVTASGAELKLSPPRVYTSAWGGTMKQSDGIVDLATTRKGNSFLCRMRRQIVSPVSLWGKPAVYSFTACGSGKINVSCYFITSCFKEKFTSNTRTVTLTPEWQEYKFTIFTTEPDMFRSWVVVSLFGKDSKVRLKDEKLTLSAAQGKEITTSAGLTILPPGATAQIEFNAPGRTTLTAFDGSKNITLRSNNGKFLLNTAPDAAPMDKVINGSVLGETAKVGVWDKTGGTACSTYISRISAQQWQKFEALSKKIRLTKPLSVLILGDSLSDQHRGFNYADELNFWLNRSNPGKYSFHNAGISGFSFQKLYLNLAARPGARDLARFKNLWQKKYDYIFIFLGHNDTVQNYDKAHKPRPANHIKILNSHLPPILKHIRRNSQAKIVLVSPASMDHDNAKKFSDRRKRPGQPYYLFALPANLRAYCTEMKKLAAKHGLGFVDMYTPTQALTDKARYFTAVDGVHLMPRGQHVIAFELLNYLSSQKL